MGTLFAYGLGTETGTVEAYAWVSLAEQRGDGRVMAWMLPVDEFRKGELPQIA